MAIKELGNPANPSVIREGERKRIPLSVPVQRLDAPEIAGYHLHWFQGTQERINRALNAGYEFVEEKEMTSARSGLGEVSTVTANADLGSRVSVASGQEIGRDGQPVRMILMKIKQEWYEEDRQLVDNRNEQVAAALRGGAVDRLPSADAAPGDTTNRYIDKSRTVIPDLFTPGAMRRKNAGRY